MPSFFRASAVFLISAMGFWPAPIRSQDQSGDARLASILKKAAVYCRKLDGAALDFVCLEEVTETSHNLSARTDVFLYDYQFVRKAEGAKERRNLLAVNGKKRDLRDSVLHAGFFQYKNVLFGPIGLLSEYWQTLLAYKLVGEDTVNGLKAVVVEATPGPDLSEPHLYGSIWISENDGSVLKIAWDQRSLGNFKSIEEWAAGHDAEPQIISFSEYGFEKNGLRFPSRSVTDQGYLRKGRKRSSSAEISVVYKDYKFFTVETVTVF